MTTDQIPIGDEIDDEAIAWYVRMRGADADLLRNEFDAWMRLGADRTAAYERVSRLFDEASVLKLSSMPVPPARQVGGTSPRQRHAALALTIVALVCASLAFGLWKFVGPSATSNRDVASTLETERGQIRTFQLADRTTVTLDTQSSLEVVGPGRQHLRLLSGRARVSVADGNPLILDAGAGRIFIRGGVLDVSLASNKVAVALLRGRAAASAIDETTLSRIIRRPHELSPSRVLGYGSRTFANLAFGPAPETGERDWPSGWREYRSIPLADLVEQANTYARRPLVLDARTSGQRRVAGRFHLADTPEFTQRIAELFDLDIIQAGNATHLRAK